MSATTTATATASATAVETSEVNVEIRPGEDVSIERLFVNLDVSNRTELGLVGSTIQEIYRTVRDTTAGRSLREIIKDILVIAFKRRNHKKSQADGEGAGEKAIFLEVLLAVLEYKNEFQDLIEAVLPLIPIYGSWRDLAVLAEEILIRPTLSGEGVGEEEVEGGKRALHPIAEAICQLFAKQLQKDFQHKDETTPSNACKYCPHESRHREKKKREREEGDGEGGEGGGGGGKRRKTHRGGERVVVSDAEKEKAKAKLAQRRRANSTLAHRIAVLVSPQFPPGTASSTLSAAFRHLRAALNQCLTVKGHLVEPRLCNKDLEHIDFIHANKGSLSKYTKAINRDEATSARWKALMKKDARAIPDLDDLLKAANAFLEGETDSSALDVFKLQLKKAVKTVGSSRQALLKKAKKLLEVGGYSAEDIEVKLGSLPSLTIILDTTGCEERNQRLSLWLAAYLLGQALGQTVIVDGEVVDITSLSEENWDSVCPSRPADPEGGRNRLERAFELATTVTSASAGSESSSQETVDVLFLCQRFQLYEQDADVVHALLNRFQTRDESNPSRKTLRSFRVHRVLHSVYGEGEVVTFTPRKTSSSKGSAPRDPRQTTADLLFVVDFTGSMGAYMDAVKANLLSLITELQASTRLKHVRVGFVGYRDYNDEGRVVTVPFCDQDNVQRVLDVIRGQHASGGGDAPEDLLSAFVAAAELEWQSDIRIQVIITDANAHGHEPGGGDSHATGRCPDQSPPYPSLEEALTALAEPLLVDTLFGKLNTSTEPTQRALYEVYQSVCGGQGFGTISMDQSGADSFREKVLAAVSDAILGSLTQKDVAGLQSADGVSVSAVTGSMNAFLRESFSKLGISLATSVKDGEQEIGETDWERLERELQLEELQPVRLALQMPLPPGQDSLSQRAANALYQAGLTVEVLEQNGYPDLIIDSYRTFIHSHLQAL
eukprot:gene6531-7204_t